MNGLSQTPTSREDLVRLYFYEGYEYRLIICFLHFINGVTLSLRQLKRILRSMNLRRRRTLNRSTAGRVVNIIQNELRGSGCMIGYRTMWKRILQKYKQAVPRDFVMKTLSQLDPLGSRLRRCKRLSKRKYQSKGPNHVWHCDGYDKLKPYGFPIHGCIDEYSRNILWLKVCSTNNDPYVIAHHYLSCVEELKGAPLVLRCDRGTENANIAFIQPFLRRNGTDCFSGQYSFRYGGSVSNQRIEAWWSQLRKCFSQWWIDLFQGMQMYGIYDETDFVHRDCLQFCFTHLIQDELDMVRHEWNTHRVRQTDPSIPAGIPNELFLLNQIQGTSNYLCPVRARDLQVAKRYTEDPGPPTSLLFLQAANELMTTHGLLFPVTVEDAISLYIDLVEMIEAQM